MIKPGKNGLMLLLSYALGGTWLILPSAPQAVDNPGLIIIFIPLEQGL